MTFDPSLWVPVADHCLEPAAGVDDEALRRTAAGRLYYAILMSLESRVRQATSDGEMAELGESSHSGLKLGLKRAAIDQNNRKMHAIRVDMQHLEDARADADYVLAPTGAPSLDSFPDWRKRATRAIALIQGLSDGAAKSILAGVRG